MKNPQEIEEYLKKEMEKSIEEELSFLRTASGEKDEVIKARHIARADYYNNKRDILSNVLIFVIND